MARRGALVRPQHDKMIAGVAAGVANYLGVSVTLTRILFVIFAFVGIGELAYIILWFVMPKA